MELQHNAQVITQVFRRYNVDAQVVPSECFQSSGMNIISVLPGASTKVAAVTRLADELDDMNMKQLRAIAEDEGAPYRTSRDAQRQAIREHRDGSADA